MFENSENLLEAQVKRKTIELYNPKYIQLLQNPVLDGDVIAVSLVDKDAIRVMQEKKQ